MALFPYARFMPFHVYLEQKRSSRSVMGMIGQDANSEKSTDAAFSYDWSSLTAAPQRERPMMMMNQIWLVPVQIVGMGAPLHSAL